MGKNSLNLKYFLNIGFYLSALGLSSGINFYAAKKIVTKIIFNKKNKLVSEGQNLINQIEVLKNQI